MGPVTSRMSAGRGAAVFATGILLLATSVASQPAAYGVQGRTRDVPSEGSTFAAESTRAGSHDHASFGTALRGETPVGDGPSAVAFDSSTDTIYVANGNNANGPDAFGNTVSVIDGRRCSSATLRRCRGPWPTVTVGNEPSTLAVDQRTHTVYVTNVDDNTVSVINGRSCNGHVVFGCDQTPATVPVGSSPIGVFADQRNHTVYVASFDDATVSIIDSSTCNGSHQSGCPSAPPPAFSVADGPGDIDVNPRTHTGYVASIVGLTAFDTTTCNATTQTGCSHTGVFTLCSDCYGPFSAKVDPVNNTIYEGDGDTSVAAIDGRACNASNLSGCASAPFGTVTVPGPFFEHVLWLAVDLPRHTVYAVMQKDDALVVIDTTVCNGAHPTACDTLVPETIHTGADPESVSLDLQTHTVYVANQVGDSVSVIDAARCSAEVTSGCRQRPPAAIVPDASGIAVDGPSRTAYVTSNDDKVAMIDTQSCNAFRSRGCDRTPPTVTVGPSPTAIAVDRETHTAYVANGGDADGSGGSVSVLDTQACNAHPSGCSTTATVQVPAGSPTSLAVNLLTHAVYVGSVTSDGTNTVSMFKGATCNASTTAGCSQTPSVMSAGPPRGPSNACGGWFVGVAVNGLTNTVYATSTEACGGVGEEVFVFDGATCGATDTSGCGPPLATVIAGSNPYRLAVDQRTNTVYAALLADGEHASSVAVIDGVTCNGSDTSGCGDTPVLAPTVFGSLSVAVDPGTHRVYATNVEDTSVSVIAGRHCNGSDTHGCHRRANTQPVDDYPTQLAIDPSVRTAYVTSGVRGTVSVLRLCPGE